MKEPSGLLVISLRPIQPGAARARAMSDSYATTEDHPRQVPNPMGSPPRDSFVPDHRIVAECGSESSDLCRLLQHRLRAASIVLVVGFGLLVLRSLFLHGPESVVVLFNVLLLGLLVLSLALLSSSWRPTLRELRNYEVCLFAGVTIFFMAAQYARMLRWVRNDNPMYFLAAVKSSVLCSFAVILTYAIFIPNTWRRSAMVILPMALAPVAVPWVLVFLHPESYAVAVRSADVGQATEHGLFLLLGAFTAIFGTHTINALRTEAREARMLNQYRLGRRLGGGGMGEVFLAEHRMLKRPCAVKLIRPERSGDAHTMARFEREVRATAQLSHWNTILIFDYGRHDDGTFYYAMEYLPGMSLDILIRRYGPMPPARVIYLLRQACDALHEAHEAGLVHRDIKPANLVAAYRGGRYDVAKLLDFGLVKTLQGGDGLQLSREDTVAGSPLYIAPEQVLHNQPPDRRADIYSLGAVAYYLLTGHPPFMGETAMEVMIAHTRDPVMPPSRIHTGVPADLEDVLLRCLAKQPDDRYPDTPSLARALAACADTAGWSPEHAAAWWQAHSEALHGGSDGPPAPTPVSESRPTENGASRATTVPATTLQSSEPPRLM
jgi:serine/threonine-protein kinase